MSVKYDFYENPCAPHQPKLNRLHARVVGGNTVDMQEMRRHLRYHGTLSESAITYALQELNDYIVEQLAEGNRVHINGLGYLSISLDCPETHYVEDHHAQSIKLKSVHFRPEKELLRKVGGRLSFVRTPIKKKSLAWKMEELRTWLTEYFQENEFITVSEIAHQCHLTQGTAYNRVRQLIDKGFLVNKGTRHNPVYMLATPRT